MENQINWSIISFTCLLLGGCATAPSAQLVSQIAAPSSEKGLFGGTHIKYESSVRSGKIYRTAEPGALAFGSHIKELCPADTNLTPSKLGPPSNNQDYSDDMGGKISGSASGIKWISLVFDIKGSSEIAVKADFKNVVSIDSLDASDIEKSVGSNCKLLIKKWRTSGHDVFVVQRAYKAEQAQITAKTSGSASGSIVNLKFVKVGPSVETSATRTRTKTFKDTIVEIEPYAPQ